jgi:hypothetical protein
MVLFAPLPTVIPARVALKDADQVGRHIFCPASAAKTIKCSQSVRALDAPSRIVQAVRCKLCPLPSLAPLAPVTSVKPRGFSWSTLLDAMPLDSQQLWSPGSRPFWGNKRADLRGVPRSYSCGARSPSTSALGFQNFHHHRQPLLETLASALFLCFDSRLTVTANIHPPLHPGSIVAPRVRGVRVPRP